MRAAALFRVAAQAEYARAQYNLGHVCRGGIGVDQDLVEARRWFELAAAQDDLQGLSTLGLFCLRGTGGSGT